jgi:hypothetical protein
MGEAQEVSRVDQSAVKVGQGSTAAVMLLAFVLDIWPLAALLAVINALATAVPALSPWRPLYRRILRPMGLVRPHVIPDHHEPHRFARAVGAVLAATSATLVAVGLPGLGWAVGWVLIFFALLNVVVGFCVGCFTYYQLNRLGIPGFSRSRLDG